MEIFQTVFLAYLNVEIDGLQWERGVQWHPKRSLVYKEETRVRIFFFSQVAYLSS